MCYCTVCEKNVHTRRKTTSYFYDRSLTYERDVCAECGSEMLLLEEPKSLTRLNVPPEPYKVFSRLSQDTPRPE